MPEPHEDVRAAFDRATALAGSDLIRQPRRLRAMLTDLVGRTGTDHRAEVEAILAAAALEEGGRPPVEADAIAALGTDGVPPELARWALATVGEHSVETASPATPPTTRSPVLSRRRLQISVASMAVAIPVVWLLLLRPEPDPAPDDSTSTVAGSVPDTGSEPPTPPPNEPTGWWVEFDDAVEGGFDVARTWQLSEGRLIATVTLTPLADSGTIQHRELVPAEAFVDPVFSPEPDNRAGGVALYNVDASSDGVTTVTVDADLVADEPDEAGVRSWIDQWRADVVELRPLDPEQPATATITPLT